MEDEVYKCIDQMGSATRKDLESLLGRETDSILGSIRQLRKKKRIYITRYTRQDGVGGRCTPHYALGDGPDAPLPKQIDHKTRNAAYRDRHRALLNARNMARRGREYNFWKGLMT